MKTVKLKKYGKENRLDYSRESDILSIPYLIGTQKESYKAFLENGLGELYREIFPVLSTNGMRSIDVLGYEICKDDIKYSPYECRIRELNYEAPVKAHIRMINKATKEVVEDFINMGNIPIMTKEGTFIINGTEKVVVTQLVRSPGCYYESEYDDYGKKVFRGQIRPQRGTWIDFEIKNKIAYVKLDKSNKAIPLTAFLKVIGIEHDYQVYDLFGENEIIKNTLEKDDAKNVKEVLLKLHSILDSGKKSPFNYKQTYDSIMRMFFNDRLYTFDKHGRYKVNQKLSFEERVVGEKLAKDVNSSYDGKNICNAGDIITKEMANLIQNSGVESIVITKGSKRIKVVSNRMVSAELFGVNGDFGADGKVYYPEAKKLIEENPSMPIEELFKKYIRKVVPMCLTTDDIKASASYMFNLVDDIGYVDDIDHLANRRIRRVDELLVDKYRRSLLDLRKHIIEHMDKLADEELTPHKLINTKILNSYIKDFFNVAEFSQPIDQNNPLTEVGHKRRVSALGPGGINKDRATFEVRDIHYTHYGRICPVETPEGKNVGLVCQLATYARINKYGFIEAPYRVVDKTNPEKPVVTNNIIYLDAKEEDKYIIAQANEPLSKNNTFVNKTITGRFKDTISNFKREEIDLMDVSPKMVFSVGANYIPFLQSDDANRALMGSNMSKQAVPLINCDSAVVSTGIERKIALDSEQSIISDIDGVVTDVSADFVKVKEKSGEEHIFNLYRNHSSSSGECMTQKPNVNVDDKVSVGDIIADGPAMKNGELALGNNPLIGFMEWEGYNYEDAVLISERLVKEDLYTSIHIFDYSVETRETELGVEEFTNNMQGLSPNLLRNLDEDGIIRIGAIVKEGDILVGKITPKETKDETAEERILNDIFGTKAKKVRNTPLKLPHGMYGTVIDVRKYSKANGDSLPSDVQEKVTVYIAQKRKIIVGDKMAGRHGNKGIVSRVLPVEDMPYLENGTPLDIVLNPLGVPSRMNIGQVLELHLGLVCKALGLKVATPSFNGATEEDINDLLSVANDYNNKDWNTFSKEYKGKLDKSVLKQLEQNNEKYNPFKGVTIKDGCKAEVYDGRTGEKIPAPISIGYMHYMKLHHLVDDKIHARSVGSYAMITQQPLGGRAQFGGQKLGEMEVWALEAHGVANVLQEMLTIKSDDVIGRTAAYNAILKGQDIPSPNTPEAFRVLLKTLQGMGFNINAYDDHMNEIDFTADFINLRANKFLEKNFGFEFSEEKNTLENNGEISENYSMGVDENDYESFDAMFDDESFDGMEE